MQNEKDYYLGLDIGTNSIGWAVTDEDYNLCRFRSKDMWGIRLFNDAKTAADRRAKRTSRRRLQRRNQRVKLLQSLFAEEVYRVDPTFFIRLNESKLWLEDKSTEFKHVLFADKDYTDVDSHKEYPTLYHLRNELITSKEPHDVRLVYLALHHILKNRGHFLISGDLETARSFTAALEQFIETINDNLDYQITVSNPQELEKILSNAAIARSDKARAAEKLIELDSPTEDKEEEKKHRAAIKEISKLIAGNQGDIKKVFYNTEFDGLEDALLKFRFSDSKYEEQVVPALETTMPEELGTIEIIKSLYDWSALVNILGNEKFISAAKVKQYKQHKKNLKLLRGILKKYLNKQQYKAFFDSLEDGSNYSNYIGTVKKNGKKHQVKHCKSEEDFYKNLIKILNGI